MSSLDFPFLDLFQQLQQAGMQLSPAQYDLLRQALNQGFGLSNRDGEWEDLRQVCRVLWVKPSRNYDEQVFEQVFERYVSKKRKDMRDLQRPKPPAQPPRSEPAQPTRRWPQVPPSKMPASPPAAASEAKTPVAVKTGLAGLPAVDTDGMTLMPRQMPLSQRAILDSWQCLRKPLREGDRTEIDLPETIRRITQAGYFSDVVMRPVKRKRVELQVLVDDSNVMLPFRPALQPLVRAIETQRMAPAALHRFITYPDDYLYDWERPFQAVPLDRVLSRMHPRRTVALVLGEAGATRLSVSAEQRLGLLTFLTRLAPCVRSLIWLNPLPPHRWRGTLAAEVASWLDGRMIYLSGPQLLALAKQPIKDERLLLRTQTVAVPDADNGGAA